MNISKQISYSFLVRDDPREGAMCYGKLEKFGSCKKKNLFVTPSLPSLPSMITMIMIIIFSITTMKITMINIIMMLFLILIYQKLFSHVTN